MTRIVARLCVLVVSAAAGVTSARALEAPAAAGGALGALAGAVFFVLILVALGVYLKAVFRGNTPDKQ